MVHAWVQHKLLRLAHRATIVAGLQALGAPREAAPYAFEKQ